MGAWAIATDTYQHTGGGFTSLIVAGARDKVTVEVAGTLDSNTNNLSLAVSVGDANQRYHECGYLDFSSPTDFHNAYIDRWNGSDFVELAGFHDLPQRLSGAFTIRVSADSTMDRIACTTSDARGPATKQSTGADNLTPGTVGVYSEFGSYRLRYLVIFGQP